ncbi:hypothetical protein BSKO_13468 [Bryopsis sp. KO-2023]|nr:hypothetical protein BSKO_13466 [Bryopsis sp. KO-2023]GMH45511.1 hypothetical protein BSKO_13468 [Bryopsis sp. KO-2023]
MCGPRMTTIQLWVLWLTATVLFSNAVAKDFHYKLWFENNHTLPLMTPTDIATMLMQRGENVFGTSCLDCSPACHTCTSPQLVTSPVVNQMEMQTQCEAETTKPFKRVDLGLLKQRLVEIFKPTSIEFSASGQTNPIKPMPPASPPPPPVPQCPPPP